MSEFIKSPKVLLIFFSVFFAILPFFWLYPGEMDLGGDSSRLYFYDPIAYLNNFGIYAVAPESIGEVQYNQYFLPFLLLLAGVKIIVQSPSLLITVFNILKLLGGFLAMYFVILEILKITSKVKFDKDTEISKYAAIIGGLFYVLSPIATGNWDKALTSHYQIFLNPFIIFFLLKFLITHNLRYAWVALFITVVFAPNFGMTSAPPFFAFYPLAILFLIFLLKLQRISFPSWRKIILVVVFFLGLHAFHLIPQIMNLFEPGSFTNTRVFDKESIAHEGIRYFIAILPLAKVSERLLLPSIHTALPFVYTVIPFVIILGLILSKKTLKVLLLTSCFFIGTLYLLTANITGLGVELYKNLFYIPGFSMFRNFIGQWAMVYMFFYALLFGLSVKVILSKFSKLNYTYVVLGLGILFIISSWNFISGAAVNKGYVTNNVRIPIQMDPAYESTLQHIKGIPDESKILMLPYTDAFYQVLAGKEGGAYVGPSTIAYMTGKKTFTGYSTMPSSFSERFFKLSREKDYEGINKLLANFNIKYVFYNSDKQIYDTDFDSSPYVYARESLPKTQNDYKEFISHITDKKVFENRQYQVFTVKNDEYLPLFYVAKQVVVYESFINNDISDLSVFLDKNLSEIRTAYVDKQACVNIHLTNDCQSTQIYKNVPNIIFKRVNPTIYTVDVKDAKEAYLLIFLNEFHSNWKIFLSDKGDQMELKSSYFNNTVQEGRHKDDFFNNPFETFNLKQIAKSKHTVVNGYANLWEITPEDVGKKKSYTLIVEMTGQRVFYVSLIVSSLIFLLFIVWGIKLFFPVQIAGIMKGIHASNGQKNKQIKK